MTKKWTRLALVPAIALLALGAGGAAQARTDVQWSVTIGTPVYAVPAPVVLPAPRPVYVEPAPVVMYPAPVYRVPPRPVMRPYHATAHWDRDGDGIPNRYDRVYNPAWDRDGDGIPNRYDRVYNPAWDRDGDGVPNRYDRHDNRWRDHDRDGVANRWDRHDRNPWRH